MAFEYGEMMEKDLRRLLAVWREVGRHQRLDESVANLLPLLRDWLGIAGIMVRRLDTARRRVETAASAGLPGSAGAVGAGTGDACPVELDEAGWRALSLWCRGASLLSGPAGRLAGRFPGLLPDGCKGPLLIGGLARDGEPLGVLILSLPARADPGGLPPAAEGLLEPIAASLENDRRLRELSSLREAAEADRRSLLTRLKRQDIADTIVGAESGLREVMERVDLVARSDTPVLILGETGSGKEVVARAIHRRSPRVAGPFLRVNCGAIPPELIDSELFGHERGSFTGAVATRRGWFERADGGTLFLDEIGELSLAAQVRLLRVLQDGGVQRVGGQQTLTVDVRLVAATHRDLQAMVADGAFRRDLWYRVAVFPIVLPGLRERPQDIPALATHFALQAAERLGLAPRVPSPADMALLVAYDWPGNVRELASVMERAAILGDGRYLDVARALGAVPAIPARPAAPREDASTPSFPTYDEASREHIETALARSAGRVEGPFGAARLLGVNPNTLRGRMRRLGIDARPYRRSGGIS
ncbi:MAG: sigma 54-interacting transcriptional regulator [Thiobacillaceae bacterium]|jgi:transcriptional regulator with GAF, ATPase, and Fis domain|nr:sigma 54-interacting transcriptional regulator [Thiobacillaceae bacterium]